MRCRVFKESVGWSEGLFLFPVEFKFSEINNYPQTSFLNKKNYLGEFEFDQNFLNILDKGKINDKTFWFEYLCEHGSIDSIKNKKNPILREEPKKVIKKLPENNNLF